MLFKILPSIRNIGKKMNIGNLKEIKTDNVIGKIIKNTSTGEIGFVNGICQNPYMWGSDIPNVLSVTCHDTEWKSDYSDHWNFDCYVFVSESEALEWIRNVHSTSHLWVLVFGTELEVA